ncbi:peptidyl-prolyl cis-trans isomerase [Brucella abortus str. 2308 A]|nr:peptidyl-prolyl cis-trans isomerase [Brucella abortus str. 2308 A]
MSTLLQSDANFGFATSEAGKPVGCYNTGHIRAKFRRIHRAGKRSRRREFHMKAILKVPCRNALAVLAASVALASFSAPFSASAVFAQDAAPGTEKAAATTAAASAEKDDPSKVLATINGKDITVGEVDQAAGDLDPQFARLPVEQRRLAALAALIDIKAMAGEAEKDKLDQTKEFKDRMEFLRERALHNEYFKNAIVDKISDADVRARYDKEIAAMPPQVEVRARHILVKTKEEAEAIIKKLEGGAKFEDLAKASSTDGTASSGGDLGYFSEGQMVPEFEKAAFALKPGEYTKEPVQTQFGYHVIQLEDRRTKQPPAYDQVKDQIRSIIMRERYIETVKKLRDGLKIDYKDPAIEKAMKDAAAAQEASGKDDASEDDAPQE